MSNSWEFVDNSVKVKAAMTSQVEAILEEVAGELESQTKRNTRVDTGQTKSAWSHYVTSDGDTHTATVGNPLENAIWEEFGTGEYALNGDGRKGGWAYQDPKTGKTIWTRGKTPSRAFFKAYSTLKNKLIKYIQSQFGKGLK